jgi:hypothetical protein
VIERLTEGNAQELKYVLPAHESIIADRVFTSYWSSPEAMANEIETWNPNKAWCQSGWGSEDGFTGTKNMQEAIALARGGWESGATQASKLMDKIRANHPIQLKKVKYDVVGSVPNVARAIAGNPLNMRCPDITKASRRPIITFLSDICASAHHDSSEFINRAAAVAAVIEQVEAAGYATDVIVFSKSHNGNRINTCSWIQVKNSNQPVDISRIAFGLGHTSMFRRFIFAEEGYHSITQSLGHGLGCVGTLERKGLTEKNMYVIPSVQGNSYFTTEESTKTAGIQYICYELRNQGFPMRMIN